MVESHSVPYAEQVAHLFRLDGQVALVAGGYGGIGQALCWALAQQGAQVAIAGRSRERAEAFAAEMRAHGFEAMGTAFDIRSVEDTQRMVERVVEACGPLDVLVNCVGTHVDTPAEAYREEDWDRVLDTNLKGAFFLSQAAGRHMIPRRRGKIVHISSVRSQLGIRRGYAAYCASKGGLNMLVKQLATEWAPYNITVNAIAPTFIRTELVRHYLEDKEFFTSLVSRIPLGRVGEPIDVVGATLYFVAPASDFVTGQILFLDGGITASQ